MIKRSAKKIKQKKRGRGRGRSKFERKVTNIGVKEEG